VAIAGAIIAMIPLLWMLSASFMPAGQASELPVRWLPEGPTLEHYVTLFEHLSLARYLLNSAAIALIATALAVVLNALAGYAFARLRFRGRDRLFRGILLSLVVPAQVGMLPLFLLLREMRLVNTYAGAIIPYLVSVFGIFLIRQYVTSIPNGLLQAARIDGAGEWRIFWTMVMPVIRPVLVTFGTFVLLNSWNDFMWPLIVLTDSRKYTLPVAVANLAGEHVQDIELMMAGSVLTVLPVVVIFLIFQRSYVRGIIAGSVKG
jgi:multiple sugar transport system permease protein